MTEIWTTDAMPVHYAQYCIVGPHSISNDADEFRRIREGNTVAAAQPDLLTVRCGTHTGPIRVTIDRTNVPPDAPSPHWETSVEVSMHASKDLGLQAWGGEESPNAGNIAHAGPGWYRVLIQTRGRDQGKALNTANEWVEEHYLTIWPAAPEAEVVHWINDRVGLGSYSPEREPQLPIFPDSNPNEDAEDSALRSWAKISGFIIDDSEAIPSYIREAAKLSGYNLSKTEDLQRDEE
ncbi:hypothetical protein ACFUJU_33570 [Streptomyces sp. NPDC057235]|uniref:hypothetical protein n=1 Tax=Streptomyces sp. NPDC057235 TaxID=3346058 RepID=UPI003627775C